MKTILFSFLLGIFLLTGCGQGGQQAKDDAAASDTTASDTVSLTEVWATDTTLRTPESVLFDPDRDVLYVSNVNMNPWEKDGNGFLSKLDTEGNILELEWVTGLDGPKGMGIANNMLYVADIDNLVEINIETGTIENKYFVEGEPSLNDVTVGDDGTVYVSGSASDKVYTFRNGQYEVLFEGELGRPNGLLYENGKLYMLTSGSSELVVFDLETMEKTKLASGFGHGDGFVQAGGQGYLASNWQGEIFYVSPDWETSKLMDTKDKNINTADLEYISEENWLLVPTFFDNRVVAYKVEK
ncbi:MAG: gluconolaconase [Bacteroidota bacterium]